MNTQRISPARSILKLGEILYTWISGTDQLILDYHVSVKQVNLLKSLIVRVENNNASP